MAKARNVEEARQKIRGIVKQELYNLKNRTIGRMIKEHMSGPTGPSSVRARSGQLRRSLDGVVVTFGGENKMSLVMFFGGGVPYARIHEYGGTILPKKSQNLAIPVGDALQKSGTARYSGPAAIFAALKFMVNKKTGKKLLIDASRGPKALIRVLFVLVPSVTLPPRLNFGKTFSEEAAKSVESIRKIRVIGWGA